MNNDPDLTRILFIIIGVFTIFFGYIINRFKLADIIAGYNPRKYDKNILCRIVGTNLILMGGMIVLVSILYYIFEQNISYWIYSSTIILIIIACLLNIMTRAKKYSQKR